MNRETALRHETELRILRRDLDQVLRVLNIRRETLKVSDLEMVHLYKTAQDYAANGWPPQVEETWATYFLRLHTDNFRQIEKQLKETHPWKAFLKLAITMLHKPYNTELSLQFSAGREHIEHMVSVWFEIKSISPRQLDHMLRHETRPSKRLLSSLERRQKKFAAKASA